MGFGTRSCMVFCYLNAVCAVFISHMFNIGINSMSVVSSINKWDRQEKARACRNAGVLYLILAVAVTVKDVIDTRRERRMGRGASQRMAGYVSTDRTTLAAELEPLLQRRADASGGRVRRSDGARGGGYGSTFL
ncbi:hypothetical protein JKF63_01815 [Porcisia hertigi]|uniref:Uncharacterized protein n=1 Tax=Porcisia hertigi TaxID=2761500 RepID=A0A836HWW3_9TRYP|nr:hypothetical protein JKF63_01815 [Porcisia hertigi]